LRLQHKGLKLLGKFRLFLLKYSAFFSDTNTLFAPSFLKSGAKIDFNSIFFNEIQPTTRRMNFLAHLFLSCENEDRMVGNFLADFLTNREVENYSEEIQKGIFLHRKIDSYTDNHPLVRQGTKRLHPRHHKYAAVIIDIFYDFLLANNWEKYSEQTLPEFTQSVYQNLEQKRDLMPSPLKKQLPRMIAKDWLAAYGTEEGLRFTFSRMKARTSRPQYFENAFESLIADYSFFDEEFQFFFPEVMKFVAQECLC